MTTRCEVPIWDKEARDYVSASLIDGVSAGEIATADAMWREVFDAEKRRMDQEKVPEHLRPQHDHWDWRKKHEATDGLLRYQMFGIEYENRMQGLMLIKTAGVLCQLPAQKTTGLVYVAYLATAPWNSPLVVARPRFGQVGTVLMRAAIEASDDLGFKGRVGLHALPQSEDWYARFMSDVGIDTNCNLRYFEMTPQQADDFIS